MPTYDFQVIDRQSGDVLRTIAVNLPIAKRDGVEFRRVTVPQRVTVMGSASDNPNDDHRIDMKHLKQAEDRHGSNFDRVFGRSKEEMRRIWSQPAPEVPATNQNAA